MAEIMLSAWLQGRPEPKIETLLSTFQIPEYLNISYEITPSIFGALHGGGGGPDVACRI